MGANKHESSLFGGGRISKGVAVINPCLSRSKILKQMYIGADSRNWSCLEPMSNLRGSLCNLAALGISLGYPLEWELGGSSKGVAVIKGGPSQG